MEITALQTGSTRSTQEASTHAAALGVQQQQQRLA
jgi:hypothetical protein